MKFIELTAINDLGDAGGPVYVAVDRINCLVPEQFGEQLKRDLSRYGQVVKSANIRLE